MSTWLPATLEPAIETMITDSIAAVYNKATATPVVITASRIKANPTAWSSFTLSWKIL
jgi:hypothetical protein